MSGDARRWRMTDAPVLSPAVDYFTRTPNGPFLDTSVEVNFGMKGHIYVSVETIREWAEIAGLLGEQKSAVEMNLHETAIYNRGLRDGLAKGEELREHLSGILAHLGAGAPADAGEPDGGGAGDTAPAAPAEEGAGDAGGAPEAAPRERRTRGKARDAAGGEGADGVSGDGSDDNSAFRI